MQEIKDDNYYLRRMLHYAQLIVSYYETLRKHGKNMTSDDQESDGIIFKFNQLREEAKNISKEYLDTHPELSRQITMLVKFRNKIIHDYENVSYSYFDEIIMNDIPKIMSEIKACLI